MFFSSFTSNTSLCKRLLCLFGQLYEAKHNPALCGRIFFCQSMPKRAREEYDSKNPCSKRLKLTAPRLSFKDVQLSPPAFVAYQQKSQKLPPPSQMCFSQAVKIIPFFPPNCKQDLKPFEVLYDPSQYLLLLLLKVEAITRIPLKNWRLFFKGRQILPNIMAFSYGIDARAELDFVLNDNEDMSAYSRYCIKMAHSNLYVLLYECNPIDDDVFCKYMLFIPSSKN